MALAVVSVLQLNQKSLLQQLIAPCACRDNRVQTAAARIRGMPAEPERLKILTRELVAHEDAIQ